MPLDPSHPDNAHLWDMREQLSMLESITAGKVFQDFEGDRTLQLAVERIIGIVGEAARRVSDETRQTQTGINRRGIIAQRHVIAHEYGAIDYERLWTIVVDHGPELKRQLDALIPPPPPDPHPE